jgi:hypothetical protein
MLRLQNILRLEDDRINERVQVGSNLNIAENIGGSLGVATRVGESSMSSPTLRPGTGSQAIILSTPATWRACPPIGGCNQQSSMALSPRAIRDVVSLGQWRISHERSAPYASQFRQAGKRTGAHTDELSEKDLDKVAAGLTYNLTQVQIKSLQQSGGRSSVPTSG